MRRVTMLTRAIDAIPARRPRREWRRRLRAALPRWRRAARRAWCVLGRGGHEFYAEYAPAEVFQRCLLCGHRTAGWQIDRRDRRRVSPLGRWP